MNTTLLENEKLMLKSVLEEFERDLSLKDGALEKLAYLSSFLLKFVNSPPRFRKTLAQKIHEIISCELFDNQTIRQKAIVRLLISVASAKLQLSELDETHELLHQILLEAERLNDADAVAEIQNLIGDLFLRCGKMSEAVTHFEEALRLFNKLKLTYSEASVLNNLGILFVNLDEYSTALGYYMQASQKLEAIGEKEKLAPVYNNLGQVNYFLNQLDDALSYYKKSMDCCEKSTMQRGVAMLYANIGAVYEKKSDYVQALHYQEKSLALKVLIEDKIGTAMVHHHIGKIHVATKEFEKAILSFQTSLSVAESIKHNETTAQALIALAQAHFSRGRYGESVNKIIDQLYQALTIAEMIGSRRIQQEAHLALAEVFENEGDYSNAYEHFKKHHSIKTEIFNEDSDKRIKNLQITYKVEEAKQQAEIERLKNIELANALAEAELERTRAEEASRIKSEVLNIVAHDLQTPISSVINFSYLLKQSPNLSVKQLELLQRIEYVSEAILKQTVNLLNAATERINDELQYETIDLSQLLINIVNDSGAIRKNQMIDLAIDQQVTVEGDREKLKEVFENLLSNAVKYSPRGKRIFISCAYLNEKHQYSIPIDIDFKTEIYALVIFKDEGLGFSEDEKAKLFGKFQRLTAKPTAGESSTGLGLYITKRLVDFHKGAIWATSLGPHQGATFFVLLPKHK